MTTVPPQLQLVWDNLNARMKHRVERLGDTYSDANLDWVGSIFIKDRIDVNHMDHQEGLAVKSVDELSIADMVPSDKEKDYVFQGLIHYFSYRLVKRHPALFKSLSSCIQPNKPHQFQNAVDSKSQEFTGPLFTKSESKTEELISMMAEVQQFVHAKDKGSS